MIVLLSGIFSFCSISHQKICFYDGHLLSPSRVLTPGRCSVKPCLDFTILCFSNRFVSKDGEKVGSIACVGTSLNVYVIPRGISRPFSSF